jgi:ATP-binding cassette subfamily C (CFTR/MRP) protein 1
VLSVLVSLVFLGLSCLEHSRSLRASFLFCTYLFFSLLFDATQSRTLLTISPSWALGRVFTATACLKGAILLLESFPKTKWALLPIPSPESSISIFSLIFYSWLNQLVWLGSRKILDVDDLYPLDPAMASKDLDPHFWATWNIVSSRGKKVRLLVALVRAMKWHLLAPMLPRAAKIAFDFCQPWLIRALQSYLSKPQTPQTAREGKGLIGATVIVYLGIASSMSIHHFFQQRATVFLRGFIVAGIYRKTTILGSSQDETKASITLMSTDVERVQLGFRNIHEIWVSSPLNVLCFRLIIE